VLLLTSTSDKVQIVTTTTANIDVHASFADVSGTTVTLGRLNTKINTATTTDVVASPAASTSRNVKTLQIANVHASASNVVTIQHTDGTNVVQIESVTLLAGERIAYREGIGTRLIDASGMEKTNVPINIGQYLTATLLADVSNSTTTAAKITGMDTPCGAGTWLFEYFLRYQSSATTTGVKLGVNHTGTVTAFMYQRQESVADTTATATQTAIADQDIVTTTGGLAEIWAQRAKSTTAPTITAGVDTINADQFAVITGLMIVTVSGNLELYHASETAASTTVKAGSILRLTKSG